MKRSSAISMALLLIGFTALSYSHQASGQGNAGWVALFDGKGIGNWNKVGDGNWRVMDGAIVADKASAISYLVTKDDYKDFEIRAEFWVDADANSGIFIRCTDPNKISSQNAYEVNIFDKRPDPAYGTGAIPNVAKALVALKAADKWNTYEIIAKGPKFTVTLNGTRTIDGAEDSKHPTGKIALQYGAGVVKFRKVEVKRL